MNDHSDLEEIMEQARELFSAAEGIIFGISRLPVNGLIFRQLGYKAEQLFNNTNKLAKLSSRFVRKEPTQLPA